MKTYTNGKEDATVVLREIKRVFKNVCPYLLMNIDELEDPRKRKKYRLSEIVLSALILFLLKRKSRNHMDAQRKEFTFSKNYTQLFKAQLPSMDAVDDVFEKMKPDQLEKLHAKLVASLIAKGSLGRFKLDGRYVIAIDGTGIHSDHFMRWTECTTKTSKNGTTTYHNLVLKASLVTENGMSLPIALEWISNNLVKKGDTKQDMELKAFKRLAIKIHAYFPHLPICITVDALYCNKPFMDICKKYGWDWVVVSKEGCLPNLQEELMLRSKTLQNTFGTLQKTLYRTKKRTHKCDQTFTYCNKLSHSVHELSWMRCQEVSNGEIHTFEYLTNKAQNKETIIDRVKMGRLRWNIEEAFNDQKNRDFEMEHLYNRTEFTAFCNWFQILQIAYVIYNLVIKSQKTQELLAQNSKRTIAAIWENLISFLKMIDADTFIQELHQWLETPRQIRLSG